MVNSVRLSGDIVYNPDVAAFNVTMIGLLIAVAVHPGFGIGFMIWGAVLYPLSIDPER